MKYVSIDIETTGVCSKTCQILEIGAVIDDLTAPEVPVENLHKFHCYVAHEFVVGEPYAMSMHSKSKILERIVNRIPPFLYIKPEEIADSFSKWLLACDMKGKSNAAGKNFAMFDLPFLNTLPGFASTVKFHYRVLDPSILYWKKGDVTLPDTKTCMERAGLVGEVAHTALEDAQMVVRLLRRKFCD
jgi:DNA polymerase III epsilon subunit-like protein